MEIIIVGTKKYFWALRAFANLFNKYWEPIPVTHFGDVECNNLPKNFTSRRVPCYTEGVWPWEHWFGNGLKSILESLASDHVCIFLPDHWITQPVDKKGIRLLLYYMRDNNDVVRGNITADTCLDSQGDFVWGRIRQVGPLHPHCSFYGGTTFSPAIWNRKNLIDILEPHWDLWQCEKLGTEKMIREWPRWRSVGVVPGPVKRAHGLYHAQPKTARLESMKQEDKQIVRNYLPAGWSITE